VDVGVEDLVEVKEELPVEVVEVTGSSATNLTQYEQQQPWLTTH
jgi:hypothetical protein